MSAVVRLLLNISNTGATIPDREPDGTDLDPIPGLKKCPNPDPVSRLDHDNFEVRHPYEGSTSS
jgi:hypothetical protein